MKLRFRDRPIVRKLGRLASILFLTVNLGSFQPPQTAKLEVEKPLMVKKTEISEHIANIEKLISQTKEYIKNAEELLAKFEAKYTQLINSPNKLEKKAGNYKKRPESLEPVKIGDCTDFTYEWREGIRKTKTTIKENREKFERERKSFEHDVGIPLSQLRTLLDNLKSYKRAVQKTGKRHKYLTSESEKELNQKLYTAGDILFTRMQLIGLIYTNAMSNMTRLIMNFEREARRLEKETFEPCK